MVVMRNKAIFYMLLCCLFYSVMYSFVKYLSNKLVDPITISFYRNFFAFIIVLPFAYKKYKIHELITVFDKFNLFRGVFSFVSILMSFYAISGMNVNKSVAISFISPIITSFLAIIIFRERLSFSKILALVLGFVGCNIMLEQKFYIPNFYELMAIGSCFVWSLSNITIKHLTKSQDPLLIILYSFLVVSILSLPGVLYSGYVPNLHDFAILLLISLSSTLAQYYLGKSFSLSEVSIVMPFDFSRIIFSSIISFFLLSEKLTLDLVLGALLVLAGNLIIWKKVK